jgi:hypothetical protein
MGDNEYGAGLNEQICKARGTVVETWSIDTDEDRRFLKRHGSAFGQVRDRVVMLAERSMVLESYEEYEFDEEREAIFFEIASLPFRRRFIAGIKIIFGKYQEN